MVVLYSRSEIFLFPSPSRYRIHSRVDSMGKLSGKPGKKKVEKDKSVRRKNRERRLPNSHVRKLASRRLF